jgi:hypothetical protein
MGTTPSITLLLGNSSTMLASSSLHEHVGDDGWIDPELLLLYQHGSLQLEQHTAISKFVYTTRCLDKVIFHFHCKIRLEGWEITRSKLKIFHFYFW